MADGRWWPALFREELAVDVSEGLELNSIATWVEKKHGGLFAWRSLKADMGFYDKVNPRILEVSRQFLESRNLQNCAEVRDWNIMSINGI